MNLEKKVNVEVLLEPFEFPAVNQLEELSKCGFACQQIKSDALLHPLVRIVIENDTDDDPTPCTPFMPVEELDFLLNGALIFQPFLRDVIKKHQADKPAPTAAETHFVKPEEVEETDKKDTSEVLSKH